MAMKVEGYSTIRRFGVDLLVQIIIVAIFYQVMNNFKDNDADKLGASHFAISVAIMAAITTYQIYKRKVAFIKSKGINLN